MIEALFEYIGIAAAICTTAAFLPQVFQTWKSRSVDGISLHMYLIFSLGLSLWIVYGLAIGSTPIIAANIVTLLLAALVLMMKVRWGRKQ